MVIDLDDHIMEGIWALHEMVLESSPLLEDSLIDDLIDLGYTYAESLHILFDAAAMGIVSHDTYRGIVDLPVAFG